MILIWIFSKLIVCFLINKLKLYIWSMLRASKYYTVIKHVVVGFFKEFSLSNQKTKFLFHSFHILSKISPDVYFYCTIISSQTWIICPGLSTVTVHIQVLYRNKSLLCNKINKNQQQNPELWALTTEIWKNWSYTIVFQCNDGKFQEVTPANSDWGIQERAWSHRRWWCAYLESSQAGQEICRTPGDSFYVQGILKCM